MYEGADFHTLSDVKEADSFRSVNLMTAGTEHINIALIHIDRDLAKCLYGICVEQNPIFFCDASNLLDRLDRSDLIVCKHNGNQDRIRTDCLF